MEQLNPHDLPKELTVTVYAYMNTEFGFVSINSFPDLSLNGNYVRLGDGVEVTFKIDGTEHINQRAIDGLRDEQQKIRAECEQQVNKIEEQIQSMLALPLMEES